MDLCSDDADGGNENEDMYSDEDEHDDETSNEEGLSESGECYYA